MKMHHLLLTFVAGVAVGYFLVPMMMGAKSPAKTDAPAPAVTGS